MTHWKVSCLQHAPKSSKLGALKSKVRLTSCSNLLSVIHAMTRSCLWKNGFISSCAPRLQSIIEGNHGKELKHKLEAETIEENCSLACSVTLFLQSATCPG